MALTKTTVKVTNISELSDKPNATEGLTSASFKALFDKSSLDLKTYLNSTLTSEVDTLITNLNSALGDKADAADVPTITSGTADPTGGSDGDIYLQYE